MVKSAREIAYIREACRITDLCFDRIRQSIRPGVTEKNVAVQLLTFFRHYKVRPSFPPIVAFGTNTGFVHHRIPSSVKRCRRQEIVLLDFGVMVHGYCSDMTRMLFVGKPKNEWKQAYETVLSVQEACLAKIREAHGQPFSGASMDLYARERIRRAGLPPYPHSLGHNLGKKIHEPPKLSRKKDTRITAGMAFTVEPGIYIKKSFGIRIEDTVVLHENGLEIVTKSPK